MARCSWRNYPDGTTGCCLPDGHETDGVTHCPHPLWRLTTEPRVIVRRDDGRNVACVRVLNTRLDPDATRDPV